MEYGGYNVNEKYSPIVAPNFYFDAVFQPGLTYSDQYAAGIYKNLQCSGRCGSV